MTRYASQLSAERAGWQAIASSVSARPPRRLRCLEADAAEASMVWAPVANDVSIVAICGGDRTGHPPINKRASTVSDWITWGALTQSAASLSADRPSDVGTGD